MTDPIGERFTYPADTVLGHAERRGNAYDGWRQLLVDVVQHDFEQSAAFRAITAQYDALEQRLETDPDRAALVEIDRLFWHYGNAAIDYGVLLGYALARTAPAGPEGWDDWLARARRLAGLDAGERTDRTRG
jgi:hypothetical protein